MPDQPDPSNRKTDDPLWPVPAYTDQIKALREAIGEALFFVEIRIGEVNTSAYLQDTPLELLAVVDFPKPDPYRRLYPHVVLLDDGRGLNLGRIARVSRTRSFRPDPGDILYQERDLLDALLYRPRQLSMARVQEITRGQIANRFGYSVDHPLTRTKSLRSPDT